MAIAITPPTTAQTYTTTTIPFTGAAASTAYVVTISYASGRKQNIKVTTDGAGAGSATFVPQHEDKGPFTVDIRPAVEMAPATSTPAATASTGRIS